MHLWGYLMVPFHVYAPMGVLDGTYAVGKHVDSEDKTTLTICDGGSNYKTRAVIINESGLYSLIMSSKLP